MKKKYWFFGTCVSAVLFSNFYLLRAYMLGNQADAQTRLTAELDETRQELSLYRSNFNFLTLNAGCPTADSRLYSMADESETTLTRLLSEADTELFVCRISQYDCDDCTYYALKETIAATKRDPSLRAVVIGEFENRRTMRIFMERLGFSKEETPRCFIAPTLSPTVERMGFPYFFSVDSTSGVSSLFMPDKSMPEETGRYFDAIKQKRGSGL